MVVVIAKRITGSTAIWLATSVADAQNALGNDPYIGTLKEVESPTILKRVQSLLHYQGAVKSVRQAEEKGRPTTYYVDEVVEIEKKEANPGQVMNERRQ